MGSSSAISCGAQPPVGAGNPAHVVDGIRPGEADVRAALDRLTSGPLFVAAKRSCQLLRYLVAEVLAGRGQAISEYAIALDVFGRSEDFDHRVDTCVRTEAWRLRGRLQRYYEGAGRDEPVRFVFPRRSFVPSFELNRPQVAARLPAPSLRLAVNVDCDLMARDEEKHFAQRLSEELAGSLLALPGVTPVLAGSAEGVDLRLRCAVRSEQGWTRIVSTLIDRDDGVQGGKAFSCPHGAPLSSPVSAADQIRAMVGDALSGRVRRTTGDQEREGDDVRFLDQLLRATHAQRGGQLAQLRKDISRLEETIADDPLDQLAHRRLIGRLGQFLSLVPSATGSIMPRLAACAHAALSLDEKQGEIWLTLGFASSYAHDWAQTEAACRRAMAIAPLDPSGYVLLALAYLEQGLLTKAIELAEMALALDPFSPMAANAYALTLNGARRFKEASQVAAHALQADRDFVKLRLTLGETMLHLGKIDQAIEEFETAYAMMPQDWAACGLLGFAYGLTGNVTGATDILARLQAPQLRGQTTYAEAIVNIGLGACEEAISGLNRAFQQGGTPGLILANATFDPIRSDNRFLRMQRQMAKGSPKAGVPSQPHRS